MQNSTTNTYCNSQHHLHPCFKCRINFHSVMLWWLGVSLLLKKYETHLRWTGFFFCDWSLTMETKPQHTCWLEWTEAFFWHVAQSCFAQEHYWEEVPPASDVNFTISGCGQLFTVKYPQFPWPFMGLVSLANMLMNIWFYCKGIQLQKKNKLSCYYIIVPCIF